MFFSHLCRALAARRGPMLRAFHTVAVVGPLVVAPGTVVEVMPFRDWQAGQADHTSPLADSHADAPRPLRPTHALRDIGSTVVPEGTSGVKGPGSYLHAGTSVRYLPPSPSLVSHYHRWPQADRAVTIDVGWRATFHPAGRGHSVTSAVRSAWEREPWTAVQQAAWENLRKRETEAA
jgi:hypothetical protein